MVVEAKHQKSRCPKSHSGTFDGEIHSILLSEFLHDGQKYLLYKHLISISFIPPLF